MYQLETKDFTRMRDLILNNKNGAGVANSIKEKRKAIARFVAGNMLCGGNFTLINDFYNKNHTFTNGKSSGVFFEHFGNRALALGVNIKDIEIAYKMAVIPRNFDTSGLPISDPSLKKKFMTDALSLTNALHEISLDALSKTCFSGK